MLKISTQISNILNHFCVKEKLPKTKTCIFPNLDFSIEYSFCPKLNQIQKHDIKKLLKHDAYGYTPIYMRDIYINVFGFNSENMFC